MTDLSGNSTVEVHQHESIESKTSYCSDDEYQCSGNNGCVPIGWLCDGQPDCQNGDDENGCPVKLQRFYDRLKVNDKTTTPVPTVQVSNFIRTCQAIESNFSVKTHSKS